MEIKFVLFMFLVTTYECNGHLPILGNIISSTRERIHSTVEGVAGAVLGGLNFGGHFGINAQKNVPQKNTEETIIVVVEEPNRDDYIPPNVNDNRPIHHNQHHHHHHHHRPHGYPGPGYNNQNQGPNYQNEYGNQNPGNVNYNQNGRPYDQNNGNYNDNGYTNDNQFNPNNPRRPVDSEQNNNNQQNNDGNSNHFYRNPTTEYVKTTERFVPSPLPHEDENKVTEDPSDDKPLLVPLRPDEYIYGEDKINISAPKRDTDKTKQTEEDEDLPIDVRFKNE